MRFLQKYISGRILCNASMACTKILMQSLPKKQKIKVSDTQLSVCLGNSCFVLPEHCAFCLWEVLTCCHRYVRNFKEEH